MPRGATFARQLSSTMPFRTQIAEVRRHLPRDLDRWITPSDRQHGVPSLARELVKQCSFALNETNIRDFLRGHQTPVPLSIAELWALTLGFPAVPSHRSD
jgi:hypothetical protein